MTKSKSSRVEEGKKLKEKIIKDKRNLFRLKKLKKKKIPQLKI